MAHRLWCDVAEHSRADLRRHGVEMCKGRVTRQPLGRRMLPRSRLVDVVDVIPGAVAGERLLVAKREDVGLEHGGGAFQGPGRIAQHEAFERRQERAFVRGPIAEVEGARPGDGEQRLAQRPQLRRRHRLYHAPRAIAAVANVGEAHQAVLVLGVGGVEPQRLDHARVQLAVAAVVGPRSHARVAHRPRPARRRQRPVQGACPQRAIAASVETLVGTGLVLAAELQVVLGGAGEVGEHANGLVRNALGLHGLVELAPEHDTCPPAHPHTRFCTEGHTRTCNTRIGNTPLQSHTRAQGPPLCAGAERTPDTQHTHKHNHTPAHTHARKQIHNHTQMHTHTRTHPHPRLHPHAADRRTALAVVDEQAVAVVGVGE
eukprot:m.531338 g.531338  ORF g.531338 m.531338 type:complete len:373 (+) comp22031_c0_seq3:275-1393(+)